MQEINKVLIVGAGIMGAGIAQVCAGAGHSVDLHDSMEGGVARALAAMQKAGVRMSTGS